MGKRNNEARKARRRLVYRVMTRHRAGQDPKYIARDLEVTEAQVRAIIAQEEADALQEEAASADAAREMGLPEDPHDPLTGWK